MKSDIMNLYREATGQTTENSNTRPNPFNYRQKNSTQASNNFQEMPKGDKSNFKSREILKYFKYVARSAGVNYSIYNLYKELRQINLLLRDYTAKEICDMIDFVFTSDQKYLDVRFMTIGVLVSKWRERIYPDTQTWLTGDYISDVGVNRHKRKKKEALKMREWGKKDTVNTYKKGVWDDD